jgi:hypothetical protein
MDCLLILDTILKFLLFYIDHKNNNKKNQIGINKLSPGQSVNGGSKGGCC